VDSTIEEERDMAYVLALLASGRRKGYTASVLDAAVEGAQSVEGVDVELVHLTKYAFGPCTSCYNCIRDEAHDCTLPDAMGGAGELMAKVKRANGWIVGDAVHCWGPSARIHLFVERCYPFVWSGGLQGMPFASISCASNQGMQRLANRELCKWAFTCGLRYVGGLPVHTAYIARARQEAVALGCALAKAAVRDAAGREKFPDQERYVDYLDKPWSVLEPYLDNLSNGTMAYDSSLIVEGLASFRRQEAKALLQKAKNHLKEALELHRAGDAEAACDQLVRASALWTHATWQEFLEEEVIGTGVPAAYRPIVE
jgi:multimeric flavodoxin WrbA